MNYPKRTLRRQNRNEFYPTKYISLFRREKNLSRKLYEFFNGYGSFAAFVHPVVGAAVPASADGNKFAHKSSKYSENRDFVRFVSRAFVSAIRLSSTLPCGARCTWKTWHRWQYRAHARPLRYCCWRVRLETLTAKSNYRDASRAWLIDIAAWPHTAHPSASGKFDRAWPKVWRRLPGAVLPRRRKRWRR